MKDTALTFTLYILGFTVVAYLLSQYVQFESIVYVLIYGLIWTMMLEIAEFVARFFLLPINQFTYFLVAVIGSAALFAVAHYLAPGIYLNGGEFNGFENGFFIIPEMDLNIVETIFLNSVILGAVAVYFRYLLDKR